MVESLAANAGGVSSLRAQWQAVWLQEVVGGAHTLVRPEAGLLGALAAPATQTTARQTALNSFFHKKVRSHSGNRRTVVHELTL